MTQTTENQVPLDRDKLADLEVIQAQFRLAVLEGPLDHPPCERHAQQRLDRRRCRRVAQEVLDLLGIQGIASHQQMTGMGRQSLLIRQVDLQSFGLPDHRALAA